MLISPGLSISSLFFGVLLTRYSSECDLLFRWVRATYTGDLCAGASDSEAPKSKSTSLAYKDQINDTELTKPVAGSPDAVAVAVAGGDFLNLENRQEEIQRYRRVYIRVSENIGVHAERLETWIYRSEWLVDKLVSSFEASGQVYNNNRTFAAAIIDFNFQRHELRTVASCLMSLRSVFIEALRHRFLIYMTSTFGPLMPSTSPNIELPCLCAFDFWIIPPPEPKGRACRMPASVNRGCG
jgi:hypothetical protein